jgi:hypothetical protein
MAETCELAAEEPATIESLPVELKLIILRCKTDHPAVRSSRQRCQKSAHLTRLSFQMDYSRMHTAQSSDIAQYSISERP